MDTTWYAIIDAGVLKQDFFSFLAQQGDDLPITCLYSEPIQPEMVSRAPYLVQITNDDIQQWLNTKTEPWGLYLESKATLRELRHHLRKYLQVQLPDQPKPVLFRFYDPRVIWNVVDIIGEWQLFRFLGAIDKIVTMYPEPKIQSFAELKAKYPDQYYQARKMLTVTEAQYAQFNHLAAQQVIDALEIMIIEGYRNHAISVEFKADVTFRPLAQACYDFCIEHDIRDERSLRGFIQLLMHYQLFSFEQIPQEWLQALSSEKNKPGHYRMTALLLKQLGYMPA